MPSASDCSVSIGNRVILNVGGRIFQSTRATFGRYEDSELAAVVSGEPEEDGMYFIDRNGDNFGHILDFLRDGPDGWLVPTDMVVLREVAHEAQCLRLSVLSRLCKDVLDVQFRSGMSVNSVSASELSG